MSSLAGRHPLEEHLLAYLDGELAAREAAEVKQHLTACWQCRTELEALETTVARCVEYRREVLVEQAPPPPKAWADLYPRFAEIDEASRKPAFPWFRMPRWVPAAVALALVLGIYQKMSMTPAAQAAVLLRNAMAAAESRGETPRRLQIRTRSARLVRTIPSKAEPVAARAALSEVERRFAAAHYDWNDPLSARAFQSWHDQLAAPKDEVATAGGRHLIRTLSASGEITEASLALRTGDLQPVEGIFRFRDNEQIEITEITGMPASAEPARATAVAPPAVTETPAALEPVPPPAAQPATLSDELQVVAALQRIGADLGESIEIHRSGDQVEVRAIGIDADRRTRVEQALSALPRASVRFTDAAPTERVVERSQAVTAAALDPALAARLEQSAGSREQLEQLAAAVLDRSDRLMARAYALRRLAERFPALAESGLSTADRGLVGSLAAEHAFVLRNEAAEMAGRMDPVLASLGVAAAPVTPALPGSWQQATTELFASARRAERLLAAMLGGAAIDVPAGELPGQLATALADLKSKSETYRQLLDNRRN